MSDALLHTSKLTKRFGAFAANSDIDFTVRSGELRAVIGPNGAGKTTLFNMIAGATPATSGEIRFNGEPITSLSGPRRVARGIAKARRGVALVPEERRIFTNRTVAENLRLAQVTAARPGWPLATVYERFPRLKERARNRGDEISGGEKQMLAIARALLGDTRLLLLDEPTEGLAPLVVREVENIVREIKAAGMTILLVEQNFESALALADRCCVVDQGAVKFDGTPAALRADPEVLRRYLHV